MSIAETARMAVQLDLTGNFNSGMGQAQGRLTSFHGATSKMSGALSHAGGQIKNLITSPLGLLGLAGGFIGVEKAVTGTISSAMNFQQAMELIATQAGGTQQEVNDMSAAVLKLSGTVATAPDVLAAGLYHIESAGLRGAKALNILTVAAEGAKVGNADLESVTNALIAAVNSGVKGTADMAQAMGVLNAVVGAGNMRMQDLADAFATGILSTAKTFGISIQSVGAAIADMTNQGVPAIDAATRLRMSINLLGAPTSKAATLFKDIGLKTLDLAKDMRGSGGILAAISDLATHMQKAGMIDKNGNVNTQGANFLSQAFGGGRSSSAIMTLVGSIGKLGDIQKQVASGAGAFGDAWAKTQQDAEFKFQRFQAILSEVGIKIGNVLLPMVNDAFTGLSDWLDAHQDDVVNFFKSAATVARSAFDTVSGLVRTVADAWTSIPPEVRDLLTKGLIADRTIKFLFGFSPVGALFSGIETALGRAVGTGLVSAGLGKLFVQPVFVTNPGFGGGGPGGLGGLAGGAEGAAAAAGGFSAAGFATLLAGALLPLWMFDIIPALFKGAPGSTDRPTVVRNVGGSRLAYDNKYGSIPGFANLAAEAHATTLAVQHENRALDADRADQLRANSDLVAANARTADRTEALRLSLIAKQGVANQYLADIKDKSQSVRVALTAPITVVANIRSSSGTRTTVNRVVARTGTTATRIAS